MSGGGATRAAAQRVRVEGSDYLVIRGRLRQELGLSAKSISTDLLETMRRLMRRDLRAGIRLDYDDPGQLRDLYERARALVEAKAPSRAAKRKAAS